MCGFVGYLMPEHIERPDLDAWSSVIAHRGPDQAGTHREGPFGVGTRRLSIQDLSAAGDQPMSSDRYVLAYNGEIYNHHELRAQLTSYGVHDYRSESDTETVLQALEQWGIQATLEQLNGMYAMAIWDRQAQELSLVRDPLGIKPVYYCATSEAVYFGSEIKALLPYTSRRTNRNAVGVYLYFGFVPAPYTLVEGINRLRPAERVVFDASGRFRSETIVPAFWSTPPQLEARGADRVHQLRHEVERAVDRQLLSDVPVGIFLSGGIDSTIIASIAARGNPGMSSFSLKPGATDQNPDATMDAQLARELAETLGLDHSEVTFGPEDLLRRLDTNMDMVDEPVAEIYALAEHILSEHSREHGVKVVLTGHGGDEVFLGYPTYNAVMRGDRYNRIPWFGPFARLLADSSFLSPGTRTNLLGASSVWRRPPLERYQIVSGVHFTAEQAAEHAGINPSDLEVILQQIFDDTLARAALLPRGIGESNTEQFARMDLLLMVPEHYNTRLDRMTMSASIEARVPFQDLELIAFVAQLKRQDLMNGGLKGMLCQAFANELPAAVRNRKKQTFQAPMVSWMNGHLDSWVKRHAPELYRHRGNGHRTKPTSPAQAAYQDWSLAILEGWQQAAGLER